MNCRSAEHLFSAFIEDELSQEERRSLESHLMSCRRCALSVKELRASLELMASLPNVETSVHFEEEVMDRIRSGEALRPTLIEWLGEMLTPARLRPVFLAGAAVCAVWISTLLIHPGTGDLRPQVARNPAETSPSANHPPEIASSDASRDAASPAAPTRMNTTPGTARTVVAAAPSVTASKRNGTAAPTGATGDYAWADDQVPMNASGVDSMDSNHSGTKYQDEYILDRFYLNRSDQNGVHSIVPVSGQSADDVYITF